MKIIFIFQFTKKLQFGQLRNIKLYSAFHFGFEKIGFVKGALNFIDFLLMTKYLIFFYRETEFIHGSPTFRRNKLLLHSPEQHRTRLYSNLQELKVLPITRIHP